MGVKVLINSLLALIPLCTGLALAYEDSPALIWSPERSMVNLPDVSSVDSFSPSDFYRQFLAPLMQGGRDNAVVFLQDKLSVDDFTNYADVYSLHSSGGAFKNVKRLMEDHYSLEVPQVASPHEAVETLKKSFEGDVHILKGLSGLGALNLGQGNRFLLIVDLHPVVGTGDEEKAIASNDAIVGQLASHLQEKGVKYSALFTGKSAQSEPLQSDESPEISGSNRHLLATSVDASSDGCQFMNVSDNSVYVFLCGFRVCIKDDKDKTKCAIEANATITKDIAVASKKVNNTGEVILTFNDLKDIKGDKYKAVVGIVVALKQDRWIMERMYLNFAQDSAGGKNDTSIQNATLINSGLDTVVPRLYSFHCSRLRLFVETLKDKNHTKYAGSSVTLDGFQFQVFDIFHDRFFHAQDCVGFFTEGIWMGIFPGLILLGILLYGTMMVLNLSVMDKFDDPKGKTITVNAGE